jgi:hypothetical protein
LNLEIEKFTKALQQQKQFVENEVRAKNNYWSSCSSSL